MNSALQPFRPPRYNLRLFTIVDVQPPFLTFYWGCAARRNLNSFDPGYFAACNWNQWEHGGVPALGEGLEQRCPRCGGEAYAALYAV